jgi:hypothetical protein
MEENKMENKIFIVYHIFDTEGEFGDAEYTEEVVGIFENETEELIPKEIKDAVKGILENDPRPGYDNDPEKTYGLDYSGFDIGFRADGENVYVFRAKKK